MILGKSSGILHYYSDGKWISITWKRVETTNEMAYYDESGYVLTINPGKTYIAVYPKNRQNLIKRKDEQSIEYEKEKCGLYKAGRYFGDGIAYRTIYRYGLPNPDV